MPQEHIDIVKKIIHNLEKQDYKGFDPYDALNSPFLFNNRKIPFLPLTMTVLFRYSGINFRKIFDVPPVSNPKALGLILSSFTKLDNNMIFKEQMEKIVTRILALRTKRYSGLSWGYPFPWQNRSRLSKIYEPSIVVTSFVSNSLIDYYNITKDKRILSALEEVCNFVIDNIHIKEFDTGICFSYHPNEKNVVLNASALISNLFLRVYKLNGDERLFDLGCKALDFIISRQKEDGMWYYSYDYKTDNPRIQTDWHQGYIIDSLIQYFNDTKDPRILESIKLGSDFYSTQFRLDGSSYWRSNDWAYPINVHNQAQGIITFSKLSLIYPEYRKKALDIANWTISNLCSKQGQVYYQKGRFFTNKIEYIRWSQSWLLLALSELIYMEHKTHEKIN